MKLSPPPQMHREYDIWPVYVSRLYKERARKPKVKGGIQGAHINTQFQSICGSHRPQLAIKESALYLSPLLSTAARWLSWTSPPPHPVLVTQIISL